MKEHEPTYSEIIAPEKYNQIITNEHLYIATADRVIRNCIEREVQNRQAKEIVEVGCGPARIIEAIGTIPNIHLIGIDHDPQFLAYAQKVIKDTRIQLALSEITEYKHPVPVDVFYSQGTHHHILKGQTTDAYLQNIYNQLTQGGAYIVGDEFLPEYKDEHERHVKAVIWYSHIISHGKKHGYTYLASEEAKTLLDDLQEGADNESIKNPTQITFVLENVDVINDAAMANDSIRAKDLAEIFLHNLSTMRSDVNQNDPTMDLSRGDYKICESVFKTEVERCGFIIEQSTVIGPLQKAGAMVVYTLRKTH